MFWTNRLSIFFILPLLFSFPASAEKFASIIIDDLGNNYEHGHDVIQLPADLTIAVLPGTTYARELARLARKKNKEVMLHLPMQSVEHHKQSPGTLGLHMTRQAFNRQLANNLNSVPYIRGVNNHMGSLLTRHPGHMSWLMEELSRRGDLYFIDSKTTNKSIADKIAMEYKIPNLSRDFFLDPEFDTAVMKKQFERFVKKVNQRGYALAIAHPHPMTIEFLKQHLGILEKNNINVIPVSALIKTLAKKESQTGKNNVACTSSTCTGL